MTVKKAFFMNAGVTKEQYEKTLRAWKDASDEMKSEQRDKAAEFYRSLGNGGG